MSENRAIVTENAEIGVIVGRFQAPTLHTGHQEVIQQVLNKHPRVILFLGQSPHICTKKDPFPYYVRRQMIEEKFPTVEVHCLHDVGDDAKWSATLDRNIDSLVGPGLNTVLYGSRDSFIKSYKGRYPTVELKASTFVSATDIRKQVGIKPVMGEKERNGVVWAMQQQYDKVVPCVDVAIYDQHTDKFLFIRKPEENKIRFCGGHSEPQTDSYETDAVKEAKEETMLDIQDLVYIGSARIDDWRWRNQHDKVKTTFFFAEISPGPQKAEAGDDVKGGDVVWVDLDEVNEDMVVTAHHTLLEILKNWVIDNRDYVKRP